VRFEERDLQSQEGRRQRSETGAQLLSQGCSRRGRKSDTKSDWRAGVNDED
jgi:hypothetical protein